MIFKCFGFELMTSFSYLMIDWIPLPLIYLEFNAVLNNISIIFQLPAQWPMSYISWKYSLLLRKTPISK